jgi:CheY-like chemotaxis protein
LGTLAISTDICHLSLLKSFQQTKASTGASAARLWLRLEGRSCGKRELVGTLVNRVLVVDDDEAIRETLQILLEDSGYIVAQARDGIEALEHLRATRERTVVLLDLMMPKLDGAGVLGTVAGERRLSEQFAFIVITANHNTLTVALATLLKSLNAAFAPKPFSDVEYLLQLVEAAARRLSGC